MEKDKLALAVTEQPVGVTEDVVNSKTSKDKNQSPAYHDNSNCDLFCDCCIYDPCPGTGVGSWGSDPCSCCCVEEGEDPCPCLDADNCCSADCCSCNCSDCCDDCDCGDCGGLEPIEILCFCCLICS